VFENWLFHVERAAPMSITKKAAEAYSLLKGAKKIRTYGKLVKESINEDTRPSGLMKLGIRGMLEIAGKALGRSLTSHPYFTYHKAHLEALGQALNASSNQDKALESLNRAIRSADATGSLSNVLADYQFRKNALKLTYAAFISGSLTLLRDYRTDPHAARQMKDAGQTPESLNAVTNLSIYEWRALWCELFLDSVQLLAMAQVELRATEAAMQRFEEKMRVLTSAGNMGRIAAYRVEQDRQWQQFERMTKPGSGREKSVEDPVGFARDQVEAIEKITDLLGEACEIAMSDDAFNSGMILHRMGSM
jgi:tetratricopeptide (TPR) repeat protein